MSDSKKLCLDENAVEGPDNNESAPPTLDRPVRLPEINAGNQNLPSLSAEAWAALQEANNPEFLFQRGGTLVRLEHDDTGSPLLRMLTPDRLRYELARCAKWYKIVDQNKKETRPPTALVRDMLADPNPPLPVIVRLTQVPVFAPDGSLVTVPGYHAAARVYYEPPKSLELWDVSPNPSKEDVVTARDIILGLLEEFPFVSEADRAHAVGLFLLLYARDLIDGPTPNQLIESPTPGTGKGLLADVLLRPAIGPNISGFSQAHTGEEWRKRLTACFLKGDAVILIDNVTVALDSAELASALTAKNWDDRLLGRNETVSIPVRCIWITTANNPNMSTEIARRSVRIRLDPGVPRPWLRSEFSQPNLRQYTDDIRTLLVWSAHTLIQAWLSAGKPAPQSRPLGSYENWSNIIGGILGHAGIPGFLGNLEDFYKAADTEGMVWREFTQRWWDKFSQKEVGVADLFPLALECEAFELPDKSERAQRISFGKQLSKQRDRVFGEFQVEMAGTAHRASRWRLCPASKGPLVNE